MAFYYIFVQFKIGSIEISLSDILLFSVAMLCLEYGNGFGVGRECPFG